MSADGTGVVCEGFLQKRKDTMKIRWVTYWFRLQNTTLFYFTKKDGNTSNLRGSYHIHTVQSVREVHRADRKGFMFEITMNNGKRKLLAAETTALRQEWVRHLCRVMHLSVSCLSNSRSKQASNHEVCEQRDRINSRDLLPAAPISSTPARLSHHEISSTESSTYPPEELSSQETTCDDLSSCGTYDEEGQGHYDVLPLRKEIPEVQPTAEMDGVYDIPRACRRAVAQPDTAESIYDVPSFILRKLYTQTQAFSSEEEPDDKPYKSIMRSNLFAAAPSEDCSCLTSRNPKIHA